MSDRLAETDTRLRCPNCGRLARYEDRTFANETICSPSNCTAWVTTAEYDHDTRQWVAVEPEREG